MRKIPTCQECENTGIIYVDEPGYFYNRTVYCDCMAGYKKRQRDKELYWAHVNGKVDEAREEK